MKCSISGLPIPFCAHCQNGLPRQFDDDSRGFRPQEPRKLAIAFPRMDVTISRSLGGSTIRPFDRSPWRERIQLRTFNALLGMKEGGLYDRREERSTILPADASDDDRRNNDDE